MGVTTTGDWGEETTTAPSGAAPPTAATTTTTTTTYNQDDWMGPAGTTTTKDWGADDGGDWGGAEPQVSGELLSNTFSIFIGDILWLICGILGLVPVCWLLDALTRPPVLRACLLCVSAGFQWQLVDRSLCA